MITTKNLRDRWAFQKNRHDMSQRAASNYQTPENIMELALAQARLDLLANLLQEAETASDTFRNRLVEIRGEMTSDQATYAINRAIEAWDKETSK